MDNQQSLVVYGLSLQIKESSNAIILSQIFSI